MLGKLLDRYREEARQMRADMVVGVVAEEGRSGLVKESAASLSPDQYAEYQRVAAKVGFAPRGLKSDELRQFLGECGIRVYPLNKVREHLDEQYGAAILGAKWVWKPLRTADQSEAMRERFASSGFGWRHNTNGAIATEQTPYAKPVPLPVLLTVERIVERFPDAKFFVSDEYSAPPIQDPFLAVVYGEDGDPVVIERWDEPNFRG